MSNPRILGMVYGVIAIVSFSGTLPATRAAVVCLDPWVVGFARPVIAGVLAAGLLIVLRQRPPARRYWKNFFVVMLGCVLGFPLLIAWGMWHLPAAHGAIALALLPLATAIAAAFRAGERPSKRFWAASAVGSIAVLAFVIISGAGRLQVGDTVMLLAVVVASLGYAEGARLSRIFSAWKVISWALVMGLPFLTVPLLLAVRAHGLSAPPSAWGGLAYVCTVSQFAGLFIWYKALAMGGIARVGQVQLLQPFCTVLLAFLLLGEAVTVWELLTATIVVAAVAVAGKATVHVGDDALALPLQSGYQDNPISVARP